MKIPNIVSQRLSTDELVLQLYIDQSLEAFAGHFDSAPIVPGVVQIEWVLTFAKQFFELDCYEVITRMDALKFQQVIQPGDEVDLKLQLSADKLLFSFTSADKKHSSGKLILTKK